MEIGDLVFEFILFVGFRHMVLPNRSSTYCDAVVYDFTSDRCCDADPPGKRGSVEI